MRRSPKRLDRWEGRVRSLLTPCPAAEPRLSRRPAEPVGWAPWRWPAWLWGALLGLGLVVGGIGAAAIAAGPVVLPYDEHFVGMSRTQLETLNPDLLGFMRHDRVSLAGAMVAIGVLYLVAAVWGQREGAPWGRQLLVASGTVGFASFFLFLGFGYFDPLHGTTTAVLFPVFLLAVLRDRPRRPTAGGTTLRDERTRRALAGQVGLTLAGLGLLGGGAVVAWVGTHGVFVPSDLSFLHDRSARLIGADDRLLPLLAHDRAGFGGALVSFAVGLLVLVVRGWRPQAYWVWWSVLASAVIGTGSTLVVHYSVGYVDQLHLAPVYLLDALVVGSLALAAPALLHRRAGRSRATGAAITAR
jgi:hypothetical protein